MRPRDCVDQALASKAGRAVGGGKGELRERWGCPAMGGGGEGEKEESGGLSKRK